VFGVVCHRREEIFLKVLVAVKRAVDYNVRVRVKADGSGVDVANARMSMNPFDEIAVEEAVRLKEAGIASEVVVVSAGPAACQDTLRTALALGADRALLIESEIELQPLAVAKLLKAVCLREQVQIVLCGKQAIDDDANQTGQMLAALMYWPQATCASKVVVSGEGGEQRAVVTREIDGGLETLEISLPAVITVDLRLNEPRYASLPNIMKARKKPLETLTPQSLDVDVMPRLRTLSVSEPHRRAAGIRVGSVDELVRCLKADGVIA
jgi:electron transfer flavoprotein beta subunit